MLKYILEIKNRLVLLFCTWMSSIFVMYFYKETLIYNITQINKNYCFTYFYFIYTNLVEIFNVYIKVIIFLANQIIILYFFYHLFFFFSPALYKLEYKSFYKIFRRVLLMWILFGLFFSYVFMPLTWFFFLSFQNFVSISLYFEAKINEFIIFYISLYYWCIFCCVVFIILFFVLNAVNKNVRFIKKFRKIYYYLFVILSTTISPPDVLSQFFISLVVVVIYEFSVFITMVKI